LQTIGRRRPANLQRGSPASQNTRPRPAERKQTKGQPRHDCQNRQANQPARFTLRSQHERRAQQEKRRCLAATTAAAASAVAFLNKNGVDAPLPLAQLHPRNALPRVSLAARIRKAGRCLTAPLARRHCAQGLGVASAPCRAEEHARKLIHGSAIKVHDKPHRVNNLQNSNRR